MMAKYILMLSIFLGFIYHMQCARWTKAGGVYSVTHGHTAIMTCEYTGDFDGFYDKTDTKIVESNKYKILDIEPGKKYTLEVVYVEESDYGNYKCKDSTSEHEATLEIAIKLEQLLPHNLAIGFEGEIKAEVYGMPRKQMEWLHNDKKIAVLDSNSQMILNEKGRYKIDTRGSLVIKKVVAEDKGKYTINILTDESRISENVNIDVGYKPSITTKPEASYTKTSGQELKLPCAWDKAEGLPVWHFTKNGSNISIQINASKVDTSSYTIASVSPNEEGKYTCKAENKYGESMVETEILQVIIPAAITSEFIDTKQNVGSDFEVKCEASGTPSPTVEITHSGKVVKSDSGSASISIVISKETVGDYKCTADNGATNVDGSSMKTEKMMNIEMLTPPKFEEDTTKDVRSAVGLPFTIKCTASGNPIPTVTLMQDGKSVKAVKTNTSTSASVMYEVTSAVKTDFKPFVCLAENRLQKKNSSIKMVEVVKAKAPTELKQSGPAGLKYIALSWEKSIGADKYVIYVNETSLKPLMTDKSEQLIQNLQQNTIYNFKVASVNLAGVGENATIVLRTSDIHPPNNITNIQASDLTTTTVLIRWEPPSNVDVLDVLYRISYCELNNGTEVECFKKNDQKDNSVQLDNLGPGTSYRIQIAPLNQKLAGHEASFIFQTLEETITPAPSPKSKKKGMSTGAVAGIIIAVILIILLVVDLFCCFFNHCGFTHCCVETFCSKKGSKYQPTETKEKDDVETQELKPSKKEEMV